MTGKVRDVLQAVAMMRARFAVILDRSLKRGEEEERERERERKRETLVVFMPDFFSK